MEQRDYILREIEKISVVLLAILGKFRRIKSKKQFEQERDMIDNDLKDTTGLSLVDLLSLSQEDIISFMRDKKGFDTRNMELMADLLVLFADNSSEEESINLINKAVIILEYIDHETRTYSMDRSLKLNSLKEKLY